MFWDGALNENLTITINNKINTNIRDNNSYSPNTIKINQTNSLWLIQKYAVLFSFKCKMNSKAF